MAKKTISWPLAPAPEARDHGRADRFLAWICGFLLGAFFLLSALDLADFLRDSTQHAIGQGSDSFEDGWRQRYLNRELLFLAGNVGLFVLVVYAARNPQRSWTKYVLRITTVVVICFITMGYIKWMLSGFDH
jgi:hypothetical protein